MLRIFVVAPSEIYEHPEGLPVKAEEIPLGPVPGWDAFALDFAPGGRAVYGPFRPVVERDGGRPFIVSRRYGAGEDRFWFKEKALLETLRPGPVWYQSGTTLRFVRSGGNP